MFIFFHLEDTLEDTLNKNKSMLSLINYSKAEKINLGPL